MRRPSSPASSTRPCDSRARNAPPSGEGSRTHTAVLNTTVLPESSASAFAARSGDPGLPNARLTGGPANAQVSAATTTASGNLEPTRAHFSVASRVARSAGPSPGRPASSTPDGSMPKPMPSARMSRALSADAEASSTLGAPPLTTAGRGRQGNLRVSPEASAAQLYAGNAPAAGISRRGALGRMLALGCLGASLVAGRKAWPADADLDIVAWKGQFPPGELGKFTERTGIRVHALEVGSDHDFLGLMHATQGREFDLLFPSNLFALEWSRFGLLKPFREDRLPVEGVLPALMAASRRDWGFGDGLLWVPHSWIGVLLFWRGKRAPGGDGAPPGYGALWDPEAGRATLGGAFHLMLGAGLHLERTGGLGRGTVWNSYRDVYRMRNAWDAILEWCRERRGAVRRLCDPGTEADPPCIPGGGARIGLAPDSFLRAHAGGDPALRFAAAAEGALLNANGAVMPAGARHVDEAHEFLRHFLDPEAAAGCAAANGLNPAPAGSAEFLPETRRKAHEQAYGDGAADEAHVLPAEPEWFRRRRADYAGRLKSALGGGSVE